MNLDQIATKCFILALFIRDDGQRLLLGDGYYDFNQKLQHFQANTIANDIVEIQGDSGQLLAGQVMRSGAQKFEGYIGDATTNRQTIEQKRSDFMAFFRIKHFYKVIYIFPDGTAIQRQRGYLTDAPTIPEIFQRFPEYSVALNFEDANYYEYAEDAEGNEIYAHIAELALSGNTTGGLIWDEIGAVSNGITWSGIQTAQGEYISITNDLSLEAPLASVEMLGDATQNGTPTPDSPQPISVVTGENVVKIEGKNLFDGNYIAYAIGGSNGNQWFAANSTRSAIIPCQPSTTYTIKKDGGSRFSIAEAPTIPENNSVVNVVFNNSAVLEHTLTTGATTRYLLVYVSNANEEPQMQAELGSTATTYEPYHGQEFEVNLGKNLLQPHQTSGTLTNVAGVSVSMNSDGSLTFNGTSTGNGWVEFGYAFTSGTTQQTSPYANLDASAAYTLSSSIKSGTMTGTSILYLQIGSASEKSANIGSSITFTGADGIYRAWIRITSGQVFSNAVICPQLEKGNSATTYAPYFTPIELAKIGNYQDRIYKADSKWYIEKQVGKVVLDGSENWASSGQPNGFVCAYSQSGSPFYGKLALGAPSYQSICDHFEFQPNGTTWTGLGKCGFNSAGAFWLQNTQSGGIIAWLASNPTTVYYVLATPTTTEITNEALIAQLEALGASSLYLGANNIGTETQNAMPTLKIEYYTEVDLDGAGYEWEPGGNTAKTIVTVAGVDSAWPVWTVQGGAQNPTLTNITTGQTITWQGFVPEGQTLTINMAEMTADLAGANVFEFITGEWIRLAPGNNTLAYNAGNADKPSTLSWNGVLA